LTFRAEKMAGTKEVARRWRRNALIFRTVKRDGFHRHNTESWRKFLLFFAGMKRSCGGKSGTDGSKLSTFQRRICW
jgi:hypothetical protein